MTRYYDDFEVSDTYEIGGTTVTKEEIITFAKQFDPQLFHTGEKAAQESMFGGLVASALHTLCLTMRLFVTKFIQGPEGIDNMGGYGVDNLRWPEPVRPGDSIRVQIEVAEKRSSKSQSDRGYVDFRLRSFADDAEVLSLISHNIVRRMGAAE